MRGSRHPSARAEEKPKRRFLLLAGIALILMGSGGSAGIRLPLGFSPSSLQCDGENLLLFGRGGAESRKVVPAAFEAIAIRVRRGRLLEPQGDSVASDFRMDAPWRSSNPEVDMLLRNSSWPRPGRTVFAILNSTSLEHGRNGELMRSRDLAASWTKVVGAPQGLLGVAFYSQSAGYVWSRNTVYHTEDGGTTWTGVESPGPLLEPFRALWRPSLDPAGGLWMPIPRYGVGGMKNNLLIRFSAAAEPPRLFPNSPFQISMIDATQGETVWLLGRHRDRPQLLVLRRIDRGESEPRGAEVANFDWGELKYFAISGNNFAVGISYHKGTVPFDSLVMSSDAGRRWEPVELPEARITAYCMAEDAALWLVGSSGRIYFWE